MTNRGLAVLLRHRGTAGLAELGRPATAIVLLLPLTVLTAGSPTGRLAIVAITAVLLAVGVARVALGAAPFARAYAWLGLLAGLLVVSFVFPQIPVSAMPGHDRPANLFGVFYGLSQAQVTRLVEFAGLSAGLALLAATIGLSPRPAQITRVMALTGAIAAGYALVCGGFTGIRLQGLGCNPNYLGYLVALPLVAAVGLTRYTRNPRWLAPAALCFIALSSTHSRGATLAATAGVAVVVSQGLSWRRQALLLSPIVAVFAAAAVLGKARPLAHRLVNLAAGDRTIADTSTSEAVRLEVAELGVKVAVAHPVRGIGYWMFPTYAQRSPDFRLYVTPHNEYVRLAAEAGALALVALVAVLWLGLRGRPDGDLAVLRAVVLAYLVVMFFADSLPRLVVSTPFWVALGCLLAARATGNGYRR